MHHLNKNVLLLVATFSATLLVYADGVTAQYLTFEKSNAGSQSATVFFALDADGDGFGKS